MSAAHERPAAEHPAAVAEPSAGKGRGIFWLVALFGVAIVSAIVIGVFGEELRTRSVAGSSALSPSALGHEAFKELLHTLDIPVIVSRHRSGFKARQGLLIVAEPEPGEGQALEILVSEARTAVLALPKRDAGPDPTHEGWIGPHWVSSDALAPLRELGIEATLVRPERTDGWSGPFTAGATIMDLQLLEHGGDLEPVVSCEQGILVGRARWFQGSEHLYVLSDPDLIATHGLDEGDNALLAVELVEALREGEGPVVFDETSHGLGYTPSFYRELFRFPLVLATAQVLLAALILAWLAALRFGAALPAPPAIAPGKGYLIRNTAALMRTGGHSGEALKRYLQTAVRQVRRALHVPEGLSGEELQRYLDRAAQGRGVKETLGDLKRSVKKAAGSTHEDPRRLVATARIIHRWRQEMLRGS